MTQVITPTHRTVRFIACGGTGIDLLRDYRDTARLEKNDIYGIEHDTYIDTSDSNLHGISAENVYRLKNIDGGGKDREKVKAAVIPVLPEILLKHPAADLNIVMFSPSGGTGSSIGPLVLGHLMKAGATVVAVMIADHTSSKSVANTINAMSDLESISRQLDKAIVIHYTKNDPTKSLLDNDTLAKFAMGAMSILGSGKNAKLDSSDVTNFINYPSVTHHKAGLAQLHISIDTAGFSQMDHVASFAALLRSENVILPALEMDYDAVGYLPSLANGYDRDFFYAVTPGMNHIVNELLSARKTLEMKKQVTVQTSSMLTPGSGSFDGNSGIDI